MSDLTWLTPAEAGERARRHPTTVRLALETGELHGHQRRRKGRWQVHIESVEAWVRGERDTAAPCGCARLRLARSR